MHMGTESFIAVAMQPRWMCKLYMYGGNVEKNWTRRHFSPVLLLLTFSEVYRYPNLGSWSFAWSLSLYLECTWLHIMKETWRKECFHLCWDELHPTNVHIKYLCSQDTPAKELTFSLAGGGGNTKGLRGTYEAPPVRPFDQLILFSKKSWLEKIMCTWKTMLFSDKYPLCLPMPWWEGDF